MALKVPKNRTLGTWASEIIAECSTSQKERIQRGAIYRSMFLTGSEDGNPQTYPKCTAFIENLSAFIYSPVELRFAITASDQSDEKAMAQAAGHVLHRELRNGNVDIAIDEAVQWSLIKGKAFNKILWAGGGFEPYVVQPEMMGVLREDLTTLDPQEAFFHRIYVTKGQFLKLVEGHPDAKEIVSKVKSYIAAGKTDNDSPDKQNMLKQVVIGAMNPFVQSPQKAPTGTNIVDWVGGPKPIFNPQILDELIPFDELWVRDAERDDWTTIQLVGTEVIEGKYIHRNIFADPKDVTDQALLEKTKKNNPLSGHHPFIEYCPNTLDGYFWGRSEINNVALLQMALNKRLDGIQKLLRLQEDPPRAFVGGSSINQTAYAKLKKPGGFLVENTPNIKIENLAPTLPADLWADLAQIEGMYDDMGGFTATMQGRGEKGVRAQGHAETLVRTASPRFKNRALRIERSVEAAGGLMLDILRARCAEKIAGWAKPGDPLPSAAPESWWKRFLRAPAPGMQRIEFLMHDLPMSCKVTVDSHSSSPAFSYESKELAFALNKTGAISPVDLIGLTHPPHEESLMMEAEAREIEHAKFMAEHPELAVKPPPRKR